MTVIRDTDVLQGQRVSLRALRPVESRLAMSLSPQTRSQVSDTTTGYRKLTACAQKLLSLADRLGR